MGHFGSISTRLDLKELADQSFNASETAAFILLSRETPQKLRNIFITMAGSSHPGLLEGISTLGSDAMKELIQVRPTQRVFANPDTGDFVTEWGTFLDYAQNMVRDATRNSRFASATPIASFSQITMTGMVLENLSLMEKDLCDFIKEDLRGESKKTKV